MNEDINSLVVELDAVEVTFGVKGHGRENRGTRQGCGVQSED